MGCMGRQRRIKAMLLVAAVGLFLTMIFVPNFLEMNTLPDTDRLENRAAEISNYESISHSSHRRRNQEQSSGISDSDHRQPERPTPADDEDISKTPPKSTQDTEVSCEARASRCIVEYNCSYMAVP
jgi:hypothetical protein